MGEPRCHQVGAGSAGQVAQPSARPGVRYLLPCWAQRGLPVLVLLRHLLPCWGQTSLPVLAPLPPPRLRLLQHPPPCPRAPGRQDQPCGHARGLAGGRAREQRGRGIWALTCGTAGRAALRRQTGVRCGCQGTSCGPRGAPPAPALTREGLPVAGDAVHGQKRCCGGHQHPCHRRPRHRRVGLEGRLGWKKAEGIWQAAGTGRAQKGQGRCEPVPETC